MKERLILAAKILFAAALTLLAARFAFFLFLYGIWFKGLIGLVLLSIILIVFHTSIRKGQ